jgi:hypothetical protein
MTPSQGDRLIYTDCNQDLLKLLTLMWRHSQTKLYRNHDNPITATPPVNHANRGNRNYGVTHRPNSTVTRETVTKLAWRSTLYTEWVKSRYTVIIYILYTVYLLLAHLVYRDYRPTPADNKYSHTSILPIMPSRRGQRNLYLSNLYGKEPTFLNLDEPCLEAIGRTTLTGDEHAAYLHRTAHTQTGTWHTCKWDSNPLPQCSRGRRQYMSDGPVT